MFHWRIPQAVCVLSVCLSVALTQEDNFRVTFTDPFYNEIQEMDATQSTPQIPCTTKDLTKWDKLFTMLENSQMRENMLLQYADDIIQVELGTLRSEVMRFVSQYGGTCGVAVENAGKQMVLQLEDRFRELLERHKLRDPTSFQTAGGPGTVAAGGDGATGHSPGRVGAIGADNGAGYSTDHGSVGHSTGQKSAPGDDYGSPGSSAGGSGISRTFPLGYNDPSGSGTAGPAVGNGSAVRNGPSGAAAAGSALNFDSNRLEATLQQLLTAADTQASKLTTMEANCLSNPGPGVGLSTKAEIPDTPRAEHHQQKVTSHDATLEGVMATLQELRGTLREVMKSSAQRNLPAGYEMALLFPMHSRRIYTSVIPEVPLSLSSFTVCMWVKPTAISNKTVLFSYGTRRNPYEIQLLLGQSSALFTVGGEAHLVEAENVANPGQWIHLCGSWSSEQGMATLWVGGKKVASIPGVAEGHTLPAGGSLQLGQERNGCCAPSPGGGSSVEGFESGFDPRLGFAGKMTGVNMWDKALSDEDISKVGQSSELMGNVVAWGVTEMVPHGGAQFTY